MIVSQRYDVTIASTSPRPCLQYCVSNHFTSLWCSPDSSALLSSGTDNVLRLYDTTSALRLSLCLPLTDATYDANWFPYMSSADPSTAAFITTARSLPIQLWDAYSGALRASYVARDHNDEHISALSVQFTADGYHVVGGYHSAIRIFDVAQSSDDSDIVRGLHGLVSTIHVHNATDALVCGTYSGYVAVVDTRSSLCTMTAEAQRTGVTSVRYVDERHIVVGGRRSNELLYFDLRDVSTPILRLRRHCTTQQKLQIDTALNSLVLCGTTDGHVIVYDVNAAADETTSAHQLASLQVSSESVNGVAFDRHNSTRQCALVAITSGQRRFQAPITKNASLTRSNDMRDEKTASKSDTDVKTDNSHEDDSDDEDDDEDEQDNAEHDMSDSRIAIWSIELQQEQEQEQEQH